MQSTPRRSWKSTVHQVLLPSAVMASGALFLLAGCQSPVQPDSFETGWGNYASSILARSIADGSMNDLNNLTDNQGVKEIKPGQTATTEEGGAVVPANPPEFSADPYSSISGPSATAAKLGQSERQVTLSLQEAIARAMQNSLIIKVEAYNPGIKEAQITEALAAFDPVFFGQSQFTNQDQPLGLTNTQVNGVNWQNNIGIKQQLSSGGTATLGTGDTYRDFQNKSLVTPNPSHEANLNVSLSQPLLRGFGSSVTRANIYLAQRDHRIALSQFKRKVISNLADVESAYHNLVLAQVSVDINSRLLDNTQNTYEKILARQNVDADRVQIKQAEAAVASRRAELIRSQTVARNTSDQLKSLINDPELDLRGNVLIVPSDRPVDVPLAYNLAEQMDIALRQRTELQEARLQVERADIIIDVARNDLLPRFDVTVSAQTNGLDGGLDQAYVDTINPANYIDYAASGKLEIPIGNRQAEAAFKRRKLERRQAITQMLQVAQQILLDVKVQMRDVMTAYREIEARRASRISAGEELAAITQKELVEKLTPEFLRLKLDSQQRLANAETAELQALVGYNLAILHLEQAKGTLLEYNHIAIDRPPVDPDENNGKARLFGTTFEMPFGQKDAK